jgi:hypothetical protein
MAKNKSRRSDTRPAAESAAREPLPAANGPAGQFYMPHPPAKNPTLLVASGILFALWFIFLLFAAWIG